MLEVKRLSVGSMQSNCYIVSSSGKAVIIDPGADALRIISTLDGMKSEVTHIILTHGHFDHISAVSELADKYNIPVIINQAEKEMLTDPVKNLSVSFIGEVVTVDTDNIIYVNETKLTLLDTDFDFIPTPGHTMGSMCICADSKLFTGDTLFYGSVGNALPPTGSLELEIQSIKDKLYSIEGDLVCYTGHGESTTLDYERKNNPFTV